MSLIPNHSPHHPLTMHKVPRHHAYFLIGQKEGTAPLVEDIFLQYGVVRERNPNVFRVDAEIFSIEEARTLKRWAFETPLGARYKIALVYADTLAIEAQQALLKILEEPPASTVFIFILPRASTLLATVRSRVFVHNEKGGIQNTSLKEAETFISAPLKDRLLFAAKVSEKLPELFSFLDVLEKELGARMHKEPKKFSEALETLYLTRRFVGDKGASRKMLTELLAMSF
jgi:hypothetical protein